MYINHNALEVSILINGKPIQTHHKDGRIYIEAKEGSEYEIRVRNSQCNRVLAVASVDGLNVIDGNTASTDGAGYVVGAYDSYTIKGFRYDDSNVGAFKFVKKENSYAEGKSVGENCGVIGVTVFEEVPQLTLTTNAYYTNTLKTPSDYQYKSGTADYALLSQSVGANWVTTVADASCTCCDRGIPKANSSLRGFDMGSGWGSSKTSKVSETTFEKSGHSKTFEFFYASRESLIEMGIIVKKTNQVAFPQSFPKYATPPKGWR